MYELLSTRRANYLCSQSIVICRCKCLDGIMTSFLTVTNVVEWDIRYLELNGRLRTRFLIYFYLRNIASHQVLTNLTNVQNWKVWVPSRDRRRWVFVVASVFDERDCSGWHDIVICSLVRNETLTWNCLVAL